MKRLFSERSQGPHLKLGLVRGSMFSVEMSEMTLMEKYSYFFLRLQGQKNHQIFFPFFFPPKSYHFDRM